MESLLAYIDVIDSFDVNVNSFRELRLNILGQNQESMVGIQPLIFTHFLLYDLRERLSRRVEGET